MSVGRDLEKQFNDPKVDHNTIAAMLGIEASNMVEVIIADIAKMIEQDYRKPLEGYVLCLSRIMKHTIAWNCITEAFSQKNEKVPSKYYELFGQNADTPHKRGGMKVE